MILVRTTTQTLVRDNGPVKAIARVTAGPQGAPGSGGALQYLDMVCPDDGLTYRFYCVKPGDTPTLSGDPTPIA